MNNNLLSLEPSQELPIEIETAILKHDLRQLRLECTEGWGARTEGKAITRHCLGTLSDAFRTALAALQ